VTARDRCTSEACVARSYDVRIAELADAGVGDE
jgi:uncharacterized protein